MKIPRENNKLAQKNRIIPGLGAKTRMVGCTRGPDQIVERISNSIPSSVCICTRHSSLLSHEFHASAPAINSHVDVLQATTRCLSKATRIRDGKADTWCRKFPLLPMRLRERIFLVSLTAFASGL